MKYLTLDEQKQYSRTVKEVKGAERDYVIMETFLGTGLRVSELAALIVGDVRNKQRMWVRPEIAKRMRRTSPEGDPREKGRFIPLPVKMQDLFHAWIRKKLERGESIEDGAPLFVSRLGERMTKRALEYMVEKWMIRAGLTAGDGSALFTVHSLRHTFAIRFMERNGDTRTALKALKEVLGHASLASTDVYTGVTDAQIAEAMHRMSMSSSRAQRLQESSL